MFTKNNKLFDTSRLKLMPLAQREHLLDMSIIKALTPVERCNLDLDSVADDIVEARKRGSSIIVMMGAHVLRDGVQRYLIDLMEKSLVSCIAMNGAGVIHDFEFAMIGRTTESVAKYISEGQFGLWNETGTINEVVSLAHKQNLGLGEAIGRHIELQNMPNKDISILAAGYRLGTPVTIHVGIGYDIVHEHANCDGAAYGAASYNDFLRFTKMMQNLEGGVVVNLGSAIMAPEVYLKSLSMVRNVAHQNGKKISNFTTLVCDLHDLPVDFNAEADRNSAAYYYRPWKTMLVRTVADGGKSYYVRGRHSETVPQLWTAVRKRMGAV